MDTQILNTDKISKQSQSHAGRLLSKTASNQHAVPSYHHLQQQVNSNSFNYLKHRRSQRQRIADHQGIRSSCSNPMGKCISKQPSAITIALSTTDLATANQILSRFSDNTDYISLQDELGNQLYEYFGQGKTEIFYESREDNSDACKRTTITTSIEDSNNNRNYRQSIKQRREEVSGDCNGSGDTGSGLDNEGQSESKKSSKKAGGGPETKGTAMSFGFRKKLHVTPKKSKNQQKQKEMLDNNLTQNCDEKTKQKLNFDTVITNTADVVENIKTATTTNPQKNDKNGNTESTVTAAPPSTTTTTTTPMVTFEKVGAGKTQAATTQGVPNDNSTVVVGRSILINGSGSTSYNTTGAISRSNRFGFKGTNTVRPASTGITPRYQSDFQDNVDNNNYSQTAGNYSNNFNNNNINSTIKRRSKSAHSGRAMTPNLSNLDRQQQQQFDESRHQPHAPKITQKSLNYHSNEYQRSRLQFLQQQQQPQQQAPSHRPTPCLVNPPQYTFVNTGMHTNVIVRPTPRPPSATFSKFTLQTTSLPKPEYPVPIRLAPSSSSAATGGVSSSAAAVAGASSSSSTPPMDQKTAKQMANNNRKGFQGSREISADSGISSLDATLAEPQAQGGQQQGSPRRNRSRPRNLQMVMSGRHKFEVRDLEDPLSSDSAVEPLALPKLPSAFSSDNQTVPLSGLIRSNTVLTREAFFRSTGSTDERASADNGQHQQKTVAKNTSDSEGLEEEKLFLDRSTSEKCAKNHQFKDINTFSKNSSPGSSRTSWCNAGESLAIKDCSSLSISSSDESKDNQNEKTDAIMPITADISPIVSDIAVSSISSNTESEPKRFENEERDDEKEVDTKPERPTSLTNISESKFAEMAAAVASEFLLDDETSPTDSLVSSTESEDVVCKRQKKKNNLEIQEKDIDEISPEFEVCSPLSPGTPTHASHSLSLSDCGRDFLIDDEIADQPALLFNESNDGADMGGHVGHSHNHSDTPTLMETGSMRSLKSQSKARSALQAAIELSLRTPVSLRKAVLNRAESLDTLSPCESICSDDLMMDFDVNSSLDSIDNRMSASIRSRSGSALHKLDDSQVFSDLEGRGSDMMRELNTILRVHNRTEKDNNMIAHLPARATRLLNRSRLQQCQLSNNGSDSPKSTDSFRRTPSRASSLHHSQRDTNSSSDDLMLHDKSFRNAMIQDVLHFKKQLLRLRRILQEDEECLMRTDTLNPFDTNNGQLFASCGLDTKFLEDIDVASLTSSTTDDPVQELADLRRQVVYLQGQVDDRDRTIRIQKNLIDKLESDNGKYPQISSEKECVNTATQTERTRPLSIGPEGLSRSKPEYTSYTTHFPATTIITTTTSPLQNTNSINGSTTNQALTPTNNQTRRHTVISTTFTNYNQISPSPRRASIAWEQHRPNHAATVVYKPVKITLIGDPMCQSTSSPTEKKHNGSTTTKPTPPNAATSPTTKLSNGSVNGSVADVKSISSSNTNSSSCSSSCSSSDLVDEENRRNLLNGGYHQYPYHSYNGKENGFDDEYEVRNRNSHHHPNINSNLKKHHHQQKHLPQQNQQKVIKKTQQQQNLTPTVTIV